MLKNRKLRYFGSVLCTTVFLSISSGGHAKAYQPFGGKLPAQLVGVKSAGVISVEAETWPGFSRTLDISLAAIQIPRDVPGVSACERDMAGKALAFVEDYLAGVKKVTIAGMKMESSAQANAEADILTDKGSLIQAMVSSGFARPNDAESGKSWCR